MVKNELYHHGTKGMKWGVRRYQNPDGSLTDAGRKRYSSAFEPTIKNGKDKPSISPAEKIVKESGNAIDNVSSIVRSASNLKQMKDGSQMSQMTDEELRNAINRMNLEKQYKSLSSERTSKGMAYVDEILKVAGGVAGVTASTLAIITTINKIRQGG